MATRGKRKRAKPSVPNPLFCKWLKEWRDEAETNGWKSVHTYGMALSSLKKYPLRLERGKDCKILMHIGDKICSMLDKKLNEHIEAGGSTELSDEESSAAIQYRSQKAAASTTTHTGSVQPTTSVQPAVAVSKRRVSSGRAYVPVYRSGPHAILLTLYQYTQVERKGDYLTKSDVILLAQPLCDKSFTVTDVGSHYTAFSSMKTLVSKYLVEKFSCPAKYRLTDEGVALAKSLNDQSNAKSTTSNQSTTLSSLEPSASAESSTSHVRAKSSGNKARGSRSARSNTQIPSSLQAMQFDLCSSTSQYPSHLAAASTAATSAAAAPLYTLHPGEYEVLLIVDNREHFGFGNAKQQILPSLNKNSVRFDVRPLSVGDFAWIAQERYGERREMVLDFIIERKRLDDLSGSIVDGRYKEQKLRMKQSGLRKPIYLIEYYTTQDNARIKEDALLQAAMNTQIIDEFYVKRCDGIKDSIAYITLLHKHIVSLYENKRIHAYSQQSLLSLPFNPADSEFCHVTYADFNSSGVKTKAPTVCDSWKRMLMCIPGVSLDKANVIVESYPSLNRLVEAYRRCTCTEERVKLLSAIRYSPTNRKLGDVCSRNMYTIFYSAEALL